MGIADRTAFPPHLDTQEEVNAAFPDDSQYGDNWFGRFWKWMNKSTKHWEAFGPRSPKGIAWTTWPIPLLVLWAVVMPPLSLFGIFYWWFLIPFCPYPVSRKWRETPIVLWSKRGDGYWRFEADGKPDLFSKSDPKDFIKENPGYYLSRVQLWCQSHKAVQWPLFFSIHKYNDPKDVLPVGTKADRDGKIWNHHIGAKRDADRIFWWIGFFLGRNFK